jgi:hypothetical protein
MNANMDATGWEHLLANPDVEAQLRLAGKGHLIDALQKGDGHSFNNVQDLQQSLQDAANAAFASGKNNLGYRMKDAAGVVQQTLEDQIPGFADITAKYAQRKGLERALKAGTEWFHKAADITGLNKVVQSLGPAELEQFRHGIASEQIIALQSKDGANAATKAMIAKNNPARQRLLQIVFEDEPTFDAFMQRARAERQLGKLANTIQGSQTHARGAASRVALADEIGTAGELLKPSNHSLPHKLKMLAWNHTIGPINRRRADAMTPQLMTQGTGAIEALLRQMEAANAVGGPGNVATQSAPATISSLFGSQSKP